MSSLRDSLSEEREKLQKSGHIPNWMITDGWQLFKEKYKDKSEIGYKCRAQNIARTAASHTKNPKYWEKKFFNIIWKGFLSCSTPVLSNMGTNKGMPVSCSGQYVGDSIKSFYDNMSEAAVLSQNGFGTSAFLGDIRPRGSSISKGGKASGILPVYEDFVTMAKKVSQGNNRRGSWAGYIPVSHPDFDEIVDFIKNKPDDRNIGFCWYNSDTELCNKGNEEAIRRFQKIMKLKMLTGKGYLFFPDKVNAKRPQMYVDLGMFVTASNLCTEITLFADLLHTYTCVLSSLNLTYWDDFEDDTIFVAIVFLDCVAQHFIEMGKLVPGLEKAVRFTEKGRALGLGVCGFHTYLQKNGIPMESLKASYINNQIFKKIQEESLKASQWLAKEFGEPEWCKGYGVRNTHRLAIAPTFSTALIMGGCSQGIEPMLGNCFIQSSAGGESERINPMFYELMKKHGKLNKKTIRSVLDNGGSCQHFDWLSPEEKLVFKTPFEMNQETLVRLTSQRQKYICQGQSFNLFFSETESEKTIAKVHKIIIEDPNMLSSYYVRTQAGVKASSGECIACQ